MKESKTESSASASCKECRTESSARRQSQQHEKTKPDKKPHKQQPFDGLF